jgi:hypothetical protein
MDSTGARFPARRRRSVLLYARAAVFPVFGIILLGLGISGLHNAREIGAHGVPAVARVSATSGYGRDTIQVSYPVDGRTKTGTLGGTGYQVGETLPVVYDPQSPGVVARPDQAGQTGSSWTEIGLGGLFLAVVPLALGISALSKGRRRARTVAG